jgi:tryptophanyl-tRNA synthetase
MTKVSKRPRVFSGVQPTGNLTLGNYIGMLAPCVDHQEDNETIFCVVDLHTLTIPESISPQERLQKTREVVGLYLACGIDPKKSVIFVQSHMKQHTELAWLLTCMTPLGWLERMTQFKSKSQKQESVGSGLLMYPVLQAADILLYETDLVPVGEDQRQHIELVCDIAQRFNHLFGETFRIPKAVIPENGARIMGFDDPTAKMSKSVAQVKSGHAVCLLDSETSIKKTIMSAVTDSKQEFSIEDASPGVINLLTIYEVLSKTSREEALNRFNGKGYGYLKKDVFDAIMTKITPVQRRYLQYTSDHVFIDAVIKEGIRTIAPLADKVMNSALQATGMG